MYYEQSWCNFLLTGKPFKEEMLMPLRSSRMSMEQEAPAVVKLDTIEKIQDVIIKVCYPIFET